MSERTEFELQTDRLTLRAIEPRDSDAIAAIIGDPEVMYAWDHGFGAEEIRDWLERNRLRAEREGYGYRAVIETSSGNLIGVCGLLEEMADGERYLGVGYIFAKRYWGRGYATESARAIVDYAFKTLGAAAVTAQIRPENTPSRRVAEKLGMTVEKVFVKHYRGKEMPHLLYKTAESSFHR